jgi:hydroxyacylglutathione hydrolase
LGNRSVEIIPIPGHDKTSIAVYDLKSKLLLTGDTFYPGRLYVRDWSAFKQSIQRLADFTSNHKIDYLAGNHIEMSNTRGKDYPTGSTYQPDESPLPLSAKDLKELNEALQKMEKPERKVFDKFIVSPK